jgi:hypothetical protein
MTSINPIDLLDIDQRMQRLMPREFVEMIEARRRRKSEPPRKPKERVLRLRPAPSDEAIEAMIGALLPVVFLEAMTSLNEARKANIPGAPIETRSVAVHEAYRLCKAMATLSDALANRRDRGRRFVTVEHVHVHAGGQAIVGAVTSPAARK